MKGINTLRDYNLTEIKAYIDDTVGKEMRNAAIKRFGYFKGSLSNSVEEAIIQWLRRNERTEERLAKIIQKAKVDENVIAIFLYGSFAEKKTGYRDIDIAFLIRKKEMELSVLAEYEDFKEDPKFDIASIDSLPFNIRKEILEKGSVILSKDKEALYDLMDATIRESERFGHAYELMVYG